MYLRIFLHICKLNIQNKNVNRRIMMKQSPPNQGLNFAMKQLSGQDRKVLEFAMAYEAATNHLDKRPALAEKL